jgi:poly(A) polymerase
VFDARIGDISGRGKLAADMREIWLMQPRFDRRVGNSVMTLVEQPRFRAGFDFLRLRAEAGEVDPELAQWWEKFSLADADERRALMEKARQQTHPPKRVRASAGTSAAAPAAQGAGSAEADDDAETGVETTSAEGEPARKRRRRRRRGPRTGEGGEGSSDATLGEHDATTH